MITTPLASTERGWTQFRAQMDNQPKPVMVHQHNSTGPKKVFRDSNSWEAWRKHTYQQSFLSTSTGAPQSPASHTALQHHTLAALLRTGRPYCMSSKWSRGSLAHGFQQQKKPTGPTIADPHWPQHLHPFSVQQVLQSPVCLHDQAAEQLLPQSGHTAEPLELTPLSLIITSTHHRNWY